jgi:ABC-type Zn uptake system ZnuABC Zn-binding protein ZnuA
VLRTTRDKPLGPTGPGEEDSGVVRSSMWRGVAALLAVTLVAGACGDDGTSETAATADGDRLVIATTVAPITSIVSNIVGDRADVRGIVPEGTNSHTFEPAPSVAELLSAADLVYVNGLVLEEPTKELAQDNM